MNNSEEQIIAALLRGRRHLCTTYEMAVPNCFTQHDSEADLFFIRESGFCDEIEIKVTRADLLQDKNKIVRYRDWEQCEFHEWHESQKGKPEVKLRPVEKFKHDALGLGLMTPNYFWLAIKEGIGSLDDIPDYAGLIEIHIGGSISIERMPKRLHSRKMTYSSKYKVAKKCFYRYLRAEFGIHF